MILIDILVIIILFTLFGLSHSLLASLNFKKKLVKNIGNRIAFYRLFYNIISLLTFIIIYDIAPKPDIIIHDLHYPFDILIFVVQVLGVIGFMWTLKFINNKEFLGINQIIRYYNGNYENKDIDEKVELVTNGPFKVVRHPIYLFSIIILAARSTMDLFYFVFLFCIISYFIIGSYFEERKLKQLLGDEYNQYQQKTARLIPYIY